MHNAVSKLTRWFWLSIFLWTTTVSLLIFSKFDGMVFPVTSDLRQIEVEFFLDGWSTVTADFDKLRNCEFVEIEWFYGRRDFGNNQSVQVRNYFDDPPQIRDTGEHHFDLLRVRLTPEQILSDSYALAVHRCYWFGFWKTRTLVFESYHADVVAGRITRDF